MSEPVRPSGEGAVDLVDLDVERAALGRARAAVEAKLERMARVSGGGADAFADEYIDAVVQGTIEKLQHELVVFGRIDDDGPWRVGLYGIDDRGEQLVVDWRAPFAGRFYQARFAEPLGLDRRVTYVGAIADLFVEDFTSGEVTGTSPLMNELSRSRGTEMRAAVATLQSEQDELVRLDPDARLVLRGGPGTGKTVVALHRAAWLVYNDHRLTAGRILVIGPSDRFLRFVSAVLPTLGEARITQTTFDRLLGPANPAGGDPRWLPLLDRFEDSLTRPAAVTVGRRTVPSDDVARLIDGLRRGPLPWRDKRRVFVQELAERYGLDRGEVRSSVGEVWPPCSTAQALKRLRRRPVLEGLGADRDLVDAWLAHDAVDGALADEVRCRFEGVPATYGHVIVDEAQDLTELQLRAVQRRSKGLTLVGDDAQRSNPHGLGLHDAAGRLAARAAEMATAYRMSAEIAAWLNEHARRHAIPAVHLVGIRPTGVEVGERSGAGRPERVAAVEAELRERWPNVAAIGAAETWTHQGVEYDGVVVDTAGMDPAETYLAASRAAHELVVLR